MSRTRPSIETAGLTWEHGQASVAGACRAEVGEHVEVIGADAPRVADFVADAAGASGRALAVAVDLTVHLRRQRWPAVRRVVLRNVSFSDSC